MKKINDEAEEIVRLRSAWEYMGPDYKSGKFPIKLLSSYHWNFEAAIANLEDRVPALIAKYRKSYADYLSFKSTFYVTPPGLAIRIKHKSQLVIRYLEVISAWKDLRKISDQIRLLKVRFNRSMKEKFRALAKRGDLKLYAIQAVQIQYESAVDKKAAARLLCENIIQEYKGRKLGTDNLFERAYFTEVLRLAKINDL